MLSKENCAAIALLAEDPCVTKFVQDVNARGGVIACICRGSMLAASSKVVAGRRMTGFNDSVSFPDLVVQPEAEAAGATWVQDAQVVDRCHTPANVIASSCIWRSAASPPQKRIMAATASSANQVASTSTTAPRINFFFM